MKQMQVYMRIKHFRRDMIHKPLQDALAKQFSFKIRPKVGLSVAHKIKLRVTDPIENNTYNDTSTII